MVTSLAAQYSCCQPKCNTNPKQRKNTPRTVSCSISLWIWPSPQDADAVCPTSSICRAQGHSESSQALQPPGTQQQRHPLLPRAPCIPPDRASIPPASAGTLCHPASVTADVSIMHEQGSCPGFCTVLNQIKMRCFLGVAMYGAAVAVWFVAMSARGNFCARSGAGAVTLESRIPIRHNKARHFHSETTGKSFN